MENPRGETAKFHGVMATVTGSSKALLLLATIRISSWIQALCCWTHETVLEGKFFCCYFHFRYEGIRLHVVCA